MEAGEGVFSMGGVCGMKGVTPTLAAFFMERLCIKDPPTHHNQKNSPKN